MRSTLDDLRIVKAYGEPNPEDSNALAQGMLSYHESKGHPRNKSYFSIFLKDKDDNFFGGVIASIEWNGLQIERIWVDEAVRNQGWGRKLMEHAEREGIKRGCNLAFLNTFSWQAPEFYEKLGYILYGKLEDFPKDSSLSYYRKQLYKPA